MSDSDNDIYTITRAKESDDSDEYDSDLSTVVSQMSTREAFKSNFTSKMSDQYKYKIFKLIDKNFKLIDKGFNELENIILECEDNDNDTDFQILKSSLIKSRQETENLISLLLS